jgi:hypothetical protein
VNRLRIVLGTAVTRAVLGLGLGALGFGRLGLTSFGVGILFAELVALLMNGRYFLKHELAENGSHVPAAAFGPVTLSTGSASLFFVGSALGWWSSQWSWLLALSGVALGTIWGWKTLEPELQARFTTLAARLYRGA